MLNADEACLLTPEGELVPADLFNADLFNGIGRADLLQNNAYKWLSPDRAGQR